MGIIRVLLALAVVFAHAGVFPLTGNKLVGGLIAVQSFYMISGFYMALVLSQRYARRSDFYFNRFLRLFPTYWFLLAASTVFLLIIGQPTFVSKILDNPALLWDGKIFMLFANLFIFGSDAMLFLYPSADGLRLTANFWAHEPLLYRLHAIPQAWTLPVEMAFYAIAPFIVKSRVRLIGIVILSLIVRYLIYTYISAKDPWTYRFFPAEAVFFCAGALAYHVYAAIKDIRISKEIGFLLFIAVLVYMVNFNRVPVLVGNTKLFPGVMLQFYIVALLALPFVFNFTRDNRIDRWLGELSYPIYLTHYFVIQWAAYLPHLPADLYAKVPALQGYYILMNTVVIAVAVNVLVQGPIERWFKRGETRPKKPIPDPTPPLEPQSSREAV